MIKAGFARVDVTPPLGSPLAGYFYDRFSDGVLDPIQLNALAFSNGTDTAVIIASDFIGMQTENATMIREAIEEKTGIPKDHVMICCLHQHTSVRIGGTVGYFGYLNDQSYLDVLYRKYVDVAKMAMDDMCEAKVGTAERRAIEDIAFVRRYVMEDGTIATNPDTTKIKPVRHCDESDNTVRLIRFKREGKNDIAYVNFSTHPDVIGGTKISADWPGFTRRFVEESLGDVSCLCVVGCEGDSNHINFLKEPEERFPKGVGLPHSRYMGQVIADTVKLVWDNTTDVVGDTVYGGFNIIYNKTNTTGEELYEEKKAFFDDYKAGKFKDNPPHITDLAFARRVVGLRKAPIYRPVPVTVLGLGSIAFVGFGGEAFTHYTIAAKEAAGEKKTVFCSCITNGSQSYLPHARAFQEGGYEAAGSYFTEPLEEQCIAAAKEMLDKF